MAWTERLQEAAYTAPDGTRIVFIYENVSKEFDKKGSAFDFPDADGTYMQPMGRTGRRYPLRLIFSGTDYDLQANAFEAAIDQDGTGKLDHPIYGTINVVPFGTIKRRDDLKTAGNQAIFEVTFWETIGLVYPTGQTDPQSAVIAAVDEYNTAAAESLAGGLDLTTAIQRATFENQYLAALDVVKSTLSGVADTQDNVRKQFNATVDSVQTGIDVLIDEPLTLALQTTALIQAPARARTSITTRLDGYANLARDLLGLNDPEDYNEFLTRDLYASTTVTGSIVSTVNTEFITKSDALKAAEVVLAQMDAVTVWRDDNFALLDEIDTGETYQKLQDAVALTAGFLVEISFSLKQEQTLVLTRARTIIDLVAELYGAVDTELDFFITSNDLSGSEILELPAGREVVYYV